MTPPPDDLDALLSGLCDGTLADDAIERLGRQVATDPDARRRYLRYVDLHAALGGPAGVPVPDLPDTRGRAAGERRRWRHARWLVPAATAAAAAVGAWAVTRPQPPAPADPVATPARAQVVVAEVSGRAELLDAAGGVTEARVGTPLRAGHTVRTDAGDGFAALDLGGASLELGPDTQLRIAEDAAGRLRVVLSGGLVRGDTRGRPGGMTVVTPQAEVWAADARFLVSVPSADTTDVEAEAGEVRAVRQADGRAVTIPAGSGAFIAADELRTERPAPAVGAGSATHPVDAAAGVAFTRDGRRLVAGLKVTQWATIDLASGAVQKGPDLRPAKRVALAASGECFLAATQGRVERYDTATGRVRGGFDAADALAAPHAVWAVSADGRAAAAAAAAAPKQPAALHVWSNDAPVPSSPVEMPAGIVRCLALSADGRLAAWGTDHPAHVTVWDVRAARVLTSTPLAAGLPRVLAFSPDGRHAAVATHLGTVRVAPTDGGRNVVERGRADGWTRPVTALAFSPDGRTLAVGRADGRVILWPVSGGGAAQERSCGRAVTGLAFSPDGDRLAVSLPRRPLLVWTLANR